MNSPPRKKAEVGALRDVWRSHNDIIDYLQEISPLHGKGIRMTRTGNGTVFAVQEITSAPAADAGTMYRVSSVADDWLLAKKFDGTNASGSDVQIAKPFGLRRAGWDGQAITYAVEAYPGAPGSLVITYQFVTAVYRIASGSTIATEHEIILPRYVANQSIILAVEPENGTGITGVTLLDSNGDGRAWAKVA